MAIAVHFRILNYFGSRHPLGSKISKFIAFFRPNLGVEAFPCASQVKEKFGDLRFYMSCETTEMSRLIRQAEKRSAITCESCGLPGKQNNRGWISTQCDDCRGFKLEEASEI